MHPLHPYNYVELYTLIHIFTHIAKHPYNCIGGIGCVSCVIACVAFIVLCSMSCIVLGFSL